MKNKLLAAQRDLARALKGKEDLARTLRTKQEKIESLGNELSIRDDEIAARAEDLDHAMLRSRQATDHTQLVHVAVHDFLRKYIASCMAHNFNDGAGDVFRQGVEATGLFFMSP